MTDDEITGIIIGCAFEVHNKLGSGFLEKVYANALRIEITKRGLKVQQEAPIRVWCEGEVVGEYYADLWVEERVVIELKAVQSLTQGHELQLVNYLTATKIETGLLLNFGSSVQVKRKYRLHKIPRTIPENLVNPG
ncbi:MAG: GxxExxY protein [Acidobacteria bacterium]|nr:GxxExxY protein [Acidobacteriota bacterium]MBI3428427.1 GxxExxY protein [Acidobacteriota bacterium]